MMVQMKLKICMKKYFRYILLLTFVSTVLLVWTSCSSDDNDGEPASPPPIEEIPEGIGTYRFRGVDYPITTGVFSVDEDGGITCVFSPDDLKSNNVTTYFSIYLPKFWLGEERNTVADDMWKNLDYIFIYDDPTYYYSQYQAVTGKLYIKQNSETNLTVSLNLRLHDNVHFKADIRADLEKVIVSRSSAGNMAKLIRQHLYEIVK